MDQIQKFIVNLSSIIVFMTAIEIIAPENAMKKYVKFVLGLILIAFMINPIVYFASNGENIITGKIKEFQDNVQKETAYTSNKTSDNKIRLPPKGSDDPEPVSCTPPDAGVCVHFSPPGQWSV